MCVVVWADKALKPNNESVGAATAPRKMVKNGKKCWLAVGFFGSC